MILTGDNWWSLLKIHFVSSYIPCPMLCWNHVLLSVTTEKSHFDKITNKQSLLEFLSSICLVFTIWMSSSSICPLFSISVFFQDIFAGVTEEVVDLYPRPLTCIGHVSSG